MQIAGLPQDPVSADSGGTPRSEWGSEDPAVQASLGGPSSGVPRVLPGRGRRLAPIGWVSGPSGPR